MARRRAMDAQVVVINHHLFFADMAVKDTGFGELVPEAQVYVFDEAHQLPEIATNYFGKSVGSRTILIWRRISSSPIGPRPTTWPSSARRPTGLPLPARICGSPSGWTVGAAIPVTCCASRSGARRWPASTMPSGSVTRC
ncbi:hypothetical protein H2136_21805 [Aeromonas hydrophila]|uniref:Helicase ATP-binding domain-containing protein n=1 Tax=Aeromonas hydrophila TaxID=644 RepID=A0A926FKU8_AERHY|nr:hypothetical protein [Aeromonas hydrophila]